MIVPAQTPQQIERRRVIREARHDARATVIGGRGAQDAVDGHGPDRKG